MTYHNVTYHCPNKAAQFKEVTWCRRVVLSSATVVASSPSRLQWCLVVCYMIVVVLIVEVLIVEVGGMLHDC